MCYYNGIKVTREEFIRLKALERRFAFLNEERVIHKGFDYGNYPVYVVDPATNEMERVEMEWGLLPPWANTAEKIKNFRFGYKDKIGKWHTPYTTLNAKSEELLTNMFADAARNRRCLVPSSGFYEWRHVQVVGKSGKLLKTPEKFPYYIEMIGRTNFYMAGIWQPVTNSDTGITTKTFAIVTTDANSLMKQIHNVKERQPTILPGDLSNDWLYNNLSDQQILDIANYQVASAEMKATPLHKDFLKRENPHEGVVYQEVPKLVY